LTFSATDLVNFLGCRHATYLDHRSLDQPGPSSKTDPLLALLRAKGLAHEQAYLERLRAQGLEVLCISARGSVTQRQVQTQAAMRAGADVIYQAALAAGPWQGFADLLIRVPGRSLLGNYLYEPSDTKLSQTAKPAHALQLSVYAMLLAAEQGVLPELMAVVLGDSSAVTLRVAEVRYYFDAARQRFEKFLASLPSVSVGEPCAHCARCRWQEHCEAQWHESDHLSQVAGISRRQRSQLEAAGIATMATLGALDEASRVPGMPHGVLQQIRTQARLQVAKRDDGENHHRLLEPAAGRGFARLPRPHPADLFFDMEGDPLFRDGLEYLFGFVQVREQTPCFFPFWGHTRAEEKRAFEAAMDFIMAQLRAHPDAYVYHYASYEESALKRLAMLHGTREADVDLLLRQGKLIDLYAVVREALQVSEPGYSIKNLETFYMEKRRGEVTSAGASVVAYEQWRQLNDPALLQEIADYNEADCRSTWRLRDWLLSLRPAATPWHEGATAPTDPDREARRLEAEECARRTTELLLEAPAGEQPFRELIGHLLEFHRRENKPAWWAMFHRQQLTEEELVDDAECIGGLRPDAATPPYRTHRSMVHTFSFPPQDFKMRVGDRPRRASTLKDAGEIVALDDDARLISLKISSNALPYEPVLSLIPQGPIDAAVLRDAVYRYAEAVIAGDASYGAISSILRREFPRVRGVLAGRPLIPEGVALLRGAAEAIANLDESHLLVQGPPGTGKTFLSAHAIVDLLAAGLRIGVASNSHKAINNLLLEIERQALERGLRFRGAKKCSSEDHVLNGAMIEDLTKNEEIVDGHYDVIGGTAWLFARPEFDRSLDYLFIDEAGQVSLANVVAMGTCARNIVLVGDQMQLAHPIQGVHPGESGRSALEFVLGDSATVDPERGIFLAHTRRMHPEVCGFISEAIYDGRLQAEEGNAAQTLLLSPGADPALRRCGISWLPIEHAGCSQKSEAEAVRVRDMFASLCAQRWINRDGIAEPIGAADILIVSPYNMQVNLLKSLLPADARVGTVDKFQGQEAAVVLVSMTSSTADDIARGLDFLYSRNRLNVAISRARCLAVVIASPALLEATCRSIEHVRLVNTLCFVKAYAERTAAAGGQP
jgi:uncharacterized protein